MSPCSEAAGPVEQVVESESPSVSIAVSPKLRTQMKKLLRSSKSNKSNKHRKAHSFADACVICKKQKHAGRWCLRDNGLVVGGWCYFCSRSAKVLCCTKNFQVLKQLPELQTLLKSKSAELKERFLLHSADMCNCRVCIPRPSKKSSEADTGVNTPDPSALPDLKQTWKSKTRLRTKTALTDYISV